MVVPWGTVGASGGFDWRFARGSLTWSDPARVKLLRDHDTKQPVGKADSFSEQQDGLYAVFSVARGPAGDEVLSLAEDGVLDGFSVGPIMGPQSFQADRSGVRDVHSARLAEVTVTAVPAFDDARVHKVAAMAGGVEMPEVKTPPAETPKADTANLEKFQAEVTAQFAGLAKGLEGQQEKLGEIIGKAFETAFSAVGGEKAQAAKARFAVVKEPPVYAFSGDSMSPSLVKDSWKFHVERDMEASDRLRKFEQQQKEMRQISFANNTGNSGQVIPPGYRPDLFVTELERRRPLNDLVSTGVISNGNPFTVPKYSSHSGAAGDHTEGTNPTSGTIVFGSKIVDPAAVSGSFQLTREIIDSSNPAIDAIALGVMREEWARITEQKLHTAILADTTPTAAFTPATAVIQIRGVLADYPFTRFAPPTGAAMSQFATKTLAQEDDTTGRPLLPSVGAQNTAGVGNAVTQGWFVDGLPFVPAWAMLGDAGSGSGVEFSEVLILNRADVWSWESPMLTFRFEEKLGPANIELALFGYYGAAVLRPEGVVNLGGTSA